VRQGSSRSSRGSAPTSLSSTLDSSVLNALGKSGLQFRIGLVEFAVALVGILIGVQYSASGVAIGVVAAAYVVMPIKLYFRCKNLDATVAGQLLPALPAALATLLMSAVTLAARELLADRYSAATALVAVVAVGVVLVRRVALRIFAPSLLAQAARDVFARAR
jgi:hypothetical protein